MMSINVSGRQLDDKNLVRDVTHALTNTWTRPHRRDPRDHRNDADARRRRRRGQTPDTASADSKALIHTLVQLGKALGPETLGEGIEQEDQLRHLQHERCDSGQGFLFARPLGPEAVTGLLDSPSPTPAAIGS
jgi:EAL domain-containing protein (putative c-di-GMP-specific phosphodiesterase class I)